MKAKLLKGLGLNGYLVTDGKNPINLFNTASGIIGDKKWFYWLVILSLICISIFRNIFY